MRSRKVLPCGLGWEKKLFVVVLLAFVVSSHEVDGKKISKERLLEVDRKLQQLNKPSLKSIESEDGDIIDCVDIYKQPAFDDPRLKNHTIQMEPSSYPMAQFTSTTEKNGTSMPEIFQTWQKSGSCPTGTIPIRRVRREDLLRATSLERYGRRSPYIAHSSSHFESNKYERRTKQNSTTNEYRFLKRVGAYLVTEDYYIGARGDISVWNPYVEDPDEYTSGQIWFGNGPYTNSESIEAGWMVHPNYYGDNKTRLFIYYTDDSGRTSGCYDLTCPAFVQISKEISIGSEITPLSTKGGVQYYLPIFIWKDTTTDNWWLTCLGKNIGYWPNYCFDRLNTEGGNAHFGGIVSSETIRPGKYTATAMGSGEEAHSTDAAFIKRIKTVDNSLVELYPKEVSEYMDEPYCYSAYNSVENLKEPEFYFGGPGRKVPYCA